MGLVGEAGAVDGLDRLGHQAVDVALHRLHRAGAQQHVLEGGHLVLVEVGGAVAGEDLREGKPTALYAYAARAADGAAAKLLADRFGAADLSDREIAELQDVLESTGARAQVERAIADLVCEALAALAVSGLTAPARRHLTELAHFVAGREH